MEDSGRDYMELGNGAPLDELGAGDSENNCVDCGGTGELDGAVCDTCEGTGLVIHDDADE